jgi:serine/threonine protein kinase
VDQEADPRIGTQVRGYPIVGFVADGAMGRVYDGRDKTSGERVAIKILHDDIAKDRIAVERFKREYETALEFDHPHIVRVKDFGETEDGSWFMAMEFLEGEELGELLRRDGPMSLERVVRVCAQIAEAIEHAHSFGVIHRDLKPDNVFLCRSADGDDVRLLDFGTVKLQLDTGPKLTEFGTTIGSPYYMSPEQAMGRTDVDQRTDVFALAAITYEMLCGKIAFEGRNIAEILMRIVKEQPEPPSVYRPGIAPAVDEAVSRGLAKDKKVRSATATAFASDVLSAFGLEGPPRTWAATPAKTIRAALAGATPRPSAPSSPTPLRVTPPPAVAPRERVSATAVSEREPGVALTGPMMVLVGGLLLVLLLGGAFLAYFLI